MQDICAHRFVHVYGYLVTSWILRKMGLLGLHVRMNGHCMIIVDQNNRSVELALLLLIKARYPHEKIGMSEISTTWQKKKKNMREM